MVKLVNYLIATVCIIVTINISLLVGIILQAKLTGNCNSRHLTVEARIAGGIKKDIESYPYVLAFIHITADNTSWNFVCGGAIASTYWAISAHHCITNYFDRESITEEDMYFIGNSSAWKHGILHPVEKIIKPDKSENNSDFDVALFKVKDPFTGSFEKPIFFAQHDYVYTPKKIVTVLGWGLRGKSGVIEERELRGVELVLYPDEDCKKIFQLQQAKLAEKKEITKRMVCAGPGRIFERSDSCNMDSGGPAVDGDILIGIVSWGSYPCGEGYPGVYVRLSEFEEWIHSAENRENKISIAKFKKTPM